MGGWSRWYIWCVYGGVGPWCSLDLRDGCVIFCVSLTLRIVFLERLGWSGISAFGVHKMGVGFLCGFDWMAWDDFVGSSLFVARFCCLGIRTSFGMGWR